MRQKASFLFLISFVFIMSCNLLQPRQTVRAEKFPLAESWSFVSDVPIYSLAVLDDWIAVSQKNGVTALDPETGQSLWKLDFTLNKGSSLFVSEGYLIAAEKNQIDVIDKTGKLVSKVDLALAKESERIEAVYSDYIFVRRFPSWNLEVYNMWTGQMVWNLEVLRANVSVSYDPSTGIVYITTTSFICAREIATGNEVWRIDKVTRTGILDAGTLYYYQELTAFTGVISAIDAQNPDNTWNAEILIKNSDTYNMMIFDDTLIASTDSGLIALNKKDGRELWKSETNESFYGKPILINNVLYARGTSSRIIYAISPENGRYLGFLHLGNPSMGSITFYKEYDIVYKFGDLLIFPFEKTVYAFQAH